MNQQKIPVVTPGQRQNKSRTRLQPWHRRNVFNAVFPGPRNLNVIKRQERHLRWPEETHAIRRGAQDVLEPVGPDPCLVNPDAKKEEILCAFLPLDL